MSEIVIEARGLTKSYGRHKAVDGVDLTVSEGDSQALRTAIDTRVHDLAVTLDSIAKPTSVPLFD